MMRRKKIWAAGWIAAFAFAAVAGCTAGTDKSEEQYTEIRETEESCAAADEMVSSESAADAVSRKSAVYTVRVTAVEGTVITGEPGTLSAAVENGFTGSGGSIRFEVTDDTTVIVEDLHRSRDGGLDDMMLGSVLMVTVDAAGSAEMVTVKHLDGGVDIGGRPVNGTAAVTLNTDGEIEGQTYTCDGNDENALRVDGASVSLLKIIVNKTGGVSSDAAAGEFYGQNAGFLALNGAQVTFADAVVDTDAANGIGVFAYGEGTAIAIADSTIRTACDNSDGIRTADGGCVTAVNLNVETQGSVSAALCGSGGTVCAEGGSFVTNGDGSSAVRCAADISVSGSILRANAGAGAVMEGNGSLVLTDCDVTGNMNQAAGEDFVGNFCCILICGSMSGDTDSGTAVFSAEGGSITSQSGDMFCVRDADCEIYLKDVEFTLINDVFLRIDGDDARQGQSTAEAGGGNVTLTADAQILCGNIFVDETSGLALTMKNGTVYTGAVNPGRAGGEVHVSMDGTSVWTLTADTYITGFEGSTGNIDANGYHLYVGGEEIL